MPPTPLFHQKIVPDGEECDAELEADMQPAHRAEALDVLATIELKFALVANGVYAHLIVWLTLVKYLLIIVPLQASIPN